MKTKIIPINPDYQWHLKYDGYIYTQLKRRKNLFIWGEIWSSVGHTLCYSLRKNYTGSGNGYGLQGFFFGRFKVFDLDTFDLSSQLDKEWIAYVNRKQKSEAINKQIENVIDRA